MRAAWPIALLLLLAPLGVLAQEGTTSSGSSSASPSPAPGSDPCAGMDDEDREECQRRHARQCRQDPSRPGCPSPSSAPPGNGTPPRGDDDAEGDEGDDGRRDPASACRDDDDDDAERDCERKVERIEQERGRDHISFRVDARNATLLDYTIRGLLALQEVRLGLDGTNLSIERQGSTLRVRDGDAELRLHDEPNGLIRFKGEQGSITLVLPANATVASNDHGARISYAGGRSGLLLAENATWLAADTVRLDGFFAFHVPPRQADRTTATSGPERPPEAKVADERKQQAIERRDLGAEVTIKAGAGATSLGAQESDTIQVLAYDDVDVEVSVPGAKAAPDAPVRVVVSSHLDEGRTIALHLDEDLLDSADPQDLLLRYFDLHNQTDGSVLETEVLFKQAASLDDVLDPADDGGQPEYWVVRDANGLQVLVSVPHWSSHAITVASISSALPSPSVALGIVAGAVASVALGAVLLWPRRRDDEL